MVQAILERLPATLELAFVAFIVALVSGAILGVLRARLPVRALRDALAVLELVARSVPVYLVALAVLMTFVFTGTLPAAPSLFAPVLTLAVPFGAWTSCLFHDCARARDGAAVPLGRVLSRPAALSIALIAPALLSATIFIEGFFAWPGIGRLIYGVSRWDGGTVLALMLGYGLAIVIIKLVAHLWLMRLGPSPRAGSHSDSGARLGFFANWIAVLGLVLCAVFVAGALLASVIPAVDPNHIDMAHWQGYPLAPGVAGHLLGTDENGRDVFSRVLIGLRNSLAIAAFAAVVATAIGLAIAKLPKVVTWFAGDGTAAAAGIRSLAAFPFVVVAATISLTHRHAFGFATEALVLGAVSWPAIVAAARASASSPRAIWAAAVAVTAGALLLETTLSFSGLGVQPPAPSLGNMLVNAQSNLGVAPWAVVYPTIVLIVALFALNAVADGLREGSP